MVRIGRRITLRERLDRRAHQPDVRRADVVASRGGGSAIPFTARRYFDPELERWEADLAARLRGARLIGEANLTRDEFEYLCRSVRRFVARFPMREAGAVLLRSYPLCLGAALVFCGVYDYHKGNYWRGAAKRLGITSQDWGSLFTEFLERWGFETFPQLDREDATRYVSRILAHGGVPSYSLGDYFALVDHALRRPELRSLPAADLIAEWRARNFSFIQIDEPVRRFLVHGGAVAEDFLQRSLDMVETGLENGIVPDASTTGLPARIPEAFERWLADRAANRPGGTRRSRLTAPRILFDPWSGDGPFVELPGQTLEAGSSRAHWRIDWGGRSMDVDVRVTRGDPPRTEAAEMLIPEPAESIRITFVVEGVDAATWQFPGGGEQLFVLAFDPDTGVMQRTGGLPARELWLLYPTTAHLQMETGISEHRCADLPIFEKFPAPYGAWSKLTAIWADLSAARSIVLRDTTSDKTIRIPVRRTGHASGRATSTLENDAVAGVWAGSERLPVVRRAPVIQIPGEAWRDDEADRWSITITPQAGSRPGERLTRRVMELDRSSDGSGRVSIPIAQPRLLPEDALGTFIVSLRGPLGSDVRLSFALIPGLQIHGLDIYKAANRDEGERIGFWLTADVPVQGRSLSPGVDVERSSGGLNVEAAGREAAIAVYPADEPNGTAPIELIVPLPLVRWALVNPCQELEWSSRELAIARDELLQRDDPHLLVDGLAPTRAQGRRSQTGEAKLTLHSSRGDVLQVMTIPLRGPRVLLPLAPFADTLRKRDDGTLVFTLGVCDTGRRTLVVERPVLRVTRALRVSHFTVEDRRVGAGRMSERLIIVSWHQPEHVTGRELRIWPLTRLWDPPIQVPIPDDVQNRYEFALPVGSVPPGLYRFELVAFDSWAPPPLRRPTGAESLCDAPLGADDFSAPATDGMTTARDLLAAFFWSGSIHHLAKVRHQVELEDVSDGLDTLSALLEADEEDALRNSDRVTLAIDALRQGLSTHRFLLSALARRFRTQTATLSDDNDVQKWEMLRALAALGIPQAPAAEVTEHLERLEPIDAEAIEEACPLFLLCLPDDKLFTDNRFRRAQRMLGADPLARLLAHEQHETISRRDHRGHRERWDELHRYFHAFEPRLFASTADLTLVTGIRDQLELMPQGILDPDTYLTAILDCLILLYDPRNARLRERAESWAADVTARAAAALDELWYHLENVHQSGIDDGLDVARKLVEYRSCDNSGRRRELDGLGLLPIAVGKTALLQRILARRPDLGDVVRPSPTFWLQRGRDAAKMAPRLYLHDLCLIDLLLTRWNTRIE